MSVGLTGASKTAEASNKRNARGARPNGWAKLYDNLFEPPDGLLFGVYNPLADVSALKAKIKELWDLLDATKDDGKVPSTVLFQARAQKKEHEVAIESAKKEREYAVKKVMDFQKRLAQCEVDIGAVPIGAGGHLPAPLKAGGRAAQSTNLSMAGPSENVYVSTKYLVEEEQQKREAIDLVGKGKENGGNEVCDGETENKKSAGTGTAGKPSRETTLFVDAGNKLKDLQKEVKNVGTFYQELMTSITADDQKNDEGLASSIKELTSTITQQQSAMAQQCQCEKKKQYLQAAELYEKLGMKEEAKMQLDLYKKADDRD